MRSLAFLGTGLALLLVQANLFRVLDGIRLPTALALLVIALVLDVARALRLANAAPGHTRAVRAFRADYALPAAVVAGHALLVSGSHAHVGRPIPTLVLPLILFMGVHEYALARGAAVAFVLGYATDVVGMAPVGLYTFTFVATFVLSRAAGLRLVAQALWMQVALVGAFAILQSIMVLVLLTIFGRDPWVPRSLYPLMIPHAIATAAVAPLIFRLSDALHAATAGSPRPEPGGSPAS